MEWLCHGFITELLKKIEPKVFGFIDHDLLPVKKINFNTSIKIQHGFYGLYRAKKGYWNLWAGYCFYSFNKVKSLPLNWLYDFSCYLDTGGRNWDPLYRFIDINLVKHDLASEQFCESAINGGNVKLQYR